MRAGNNAEVEANGPPPHPRNEVNRPLAPWRHSVVQWPLGMALLITLQGPEVGRRFPLSGDQTVVGRLYESNICLTGQAVSRQHARILTRDGGFLVEDLGSSNGTFLNGVRLAPNLPSAFTDRDQ